jgi:hypothetical protein
MTNGDQIFLQAFETGALPFERWDHKAHIRMAWLYLTSYENPQALKKIKDGIMNYNSIHKEKIKTGYCEKTTQTWIKIISEKIKTKKEISFPSFIEQNNELIDKN